MTEETEIQTEGQTEEAKIAKSIIDPKYRDRYKTGEKDWVSRFIEDQISVKSEDGKSVVFSTDELFNLALQNNAKADKITAYRAQSDSHGFAGRMRMTVGNILRAMAKQRHGLKDLKGKFHKVDDEFKAKHNLPPNPTHDKDGAIIVVKEPKAKKEDQAA